MATILITQDWPFLDKVFSPILAPGSTLSLDMPIISGADEIGGQCSLRWHGES